MLIPLLACAGRPRIVVIAAAGARFDRRSSAPGAKFVESEVELFAGSLPSRLEMRGLPWSPLLILFIHPA